MAKPLEQLLDEYTEALHQRDVLNARIKSMREALTNGARREIDPPKAETANRNGDNPFLAWRRERGLSQADAAERAGISGSGWRLWENGHGISEKSLEKLPRGLRGAVQRYLALATT
jgi:DNA-binding XRE family transcriptional regulator